MHLGLSGQWSLQNPIRRECRAHVIMILRTVLIRHFFIPSFAPQTEHGLGVQKMGETTAKWALELPETIVRLELFQEVEDDKTADDQPAGL